MDAREIIEAQIPFPLDDEIYSEKIIAALTAAGYQIIHRDENHGPTLERAAGVVLSQPCMNQQTGYWRQNIAAAICAMGEKK